ncbi:MULTISPECIES: hypothetical protein [Aeromonas]|uniref:hypothetical protein n=1 Tax=Aeromonas TaxID=642 RepID=UPI000280744A|nr:MULTISPECIES: hypothetical protein [Aeromonas]EKB20559.1 hypothetical protein HMPREF1170_03290 [Aeromonas veronii AMC35]TNH85454.1 hypothetical protein CF140_06595 [Aeromonas sobria]
MESYTNFITAAICRMVKIAPVLFSKKMNLASKFYYETKEWQEQNAERKTNNIITHYSLLNPQLKWKAKAISSFCSISQDNAIKLKDWKIKNSYLDDSYAKNSMFNNGFLNVGFFNIGSASKGYHVDGYIHYQSDYIERCSIQIIHIDGGLAFLALYWILSDKATELLKDIDVTDIKPEQIQYLSCNPFSTQFVASTTIGRLNLSEERLLSRLEFLHKEIQLAESQLYNFFGISQTEVPVYTMDIHIDDISPYFIEKVTPPKEINNDNCDAHFIKHFYGNILSFKSDDFKRCLFPIRYLRPRTTPPKISHLYIASQASEEVDEHRFNDFSARLFSPINSHHIYQFLHICDARFERLDQNYSQSIIDSYNESPDKSYNHIYSSFVEILKIEELLTAFIESKLDFIHYRMDDSLNYEIFFEKARVYLGDVRKIKESLELKKQASNEKVQSANLSYQKRMTWFVAILTIIQIFLAINSQQISSFVSWISSFDFIQL